MAERMVTIERVDKRAFEKAFANGDRVAIIGALL